jgi:myo-inositol-1(or 4)-monophosphatase
MADFWTRVLDFAQAITTDVGKQLILDFGRVQAAQKSDGSLVTQADKWADETICRAIAKNFPDHGILSEEGAHIFPGTLWCWVIDPLDGTTNFTRGLPIWGISLGLLYQGTPVFGYVYFPVLNQTFHGFYAETPDLNIPKGAFLNNQPIQTSKDLPSNQHFFNLCSRSTAILQNEFPCKIRMLGVATYNFLTVAMGACLGGLEATPKVWDIAGAWVIVQAAGASWLSLSPYPFPLLYETDYGDQPFPTLIVSQAELIPVFIPYVAKIKLYEPDFGV